MMVSFRKIYVNIKKWNLKKLELLFFSKKNKKNYTFNEIMILLNKRFQRSISFTEQTYS